LGLAGLPLLLSRSLVLAVAVVVAVVILGDEVVEGVAGGGEGVAVLDAEVAGVHGVGVGCGGEAAGLFVVVDVGGWIQDEGAVPASAGHDVVVFEFAVGALDGGGGRRWVLRKKFVVDGSRCRWQVMGRLGRRRLSGSSIRAGIRRCPFRSTHQAAAPGRTVTASRRSVPT
jgi:hypothetical protein